MKRFALAVIAVGAFSASASAATCDKDYTDFWAKIGNSAGAKQLTAQQYAQLSRTALRGYDACTSGDERFNAQNFFSKLEQVNPAKATDIFKELEKSFPAKK